MSLAIGGGLINALLDAGTLHQVRETRIQMGSPISISVLHTARSAARRMITSAFNEIERLEAMLSRHRPDSEISRLNENGKVTDAPAEVIHVITQALEYSSLTSGAFDITMKPLLDLHESSFEQTARPPSDSSIREALALVGYKKVILNDANVELSQQGMSLTVDGIAKGYIADKAVDILKRDGAERVLVDAGGDFGLAGGGNAGDGWNIAVENPRKPGNYLTTLHLTDRSVATSGDYMQHFTADRLFHHIIDPRTGFSPDHTSAVTVVASKAMIADALSTAALVLGPAEGLELLENEDDVEGIIIRKNQEAFSTSGMAAISS